MSDVSDSGQAGTPSTHLIDTRPPGGATLATTVIERHVRLHLQHHDPASLFAGKVAALLQRAYTKGRDLYDLAWYLDQPEWPQPNLVLLNQALAQTGWRGPSITVTNWCELVQNRLLTIGWERSVDDVTPFIIDGSMTLLNREVVLQRLQQRCVS